MNRNTDLQQNDLESLVNNNESIDIDMNENLQNEDVSSVFIY